MIIYTCWQNDRDFGELYEPWVGHRPRHEGVEFNSHWFAARDNETGKWLGAVQYIIIDDPIFDRRWALVENVYVDKAYRRQGIASALMKGVERLAFTFGCKYIKLTSRKDDGKALYRSMGYEEGSSFRKELSCDKVFPDFGKEES